MVYVAGVINHIPRFEFLVWSATLGSLGYTTARTFPTFKAAEAHAGPIKRSPVLYNDAPARNGRPARLSPLIQLRLGMLGHVIGRFLPLIVRLVESLRRGPGQPAWKSFWSLPVPTRRAGFMGMTRAVDVGRVNRLRAVGILLAVGVEFFQYGVTKTLGDQFHVIGVRENPRLVDHGAFRVVRHPMYRFAFGFPSQTYNRWC